MEKENICRLLGIKRQRDFGKPLKIDLENRRA
jgi:hypothetical protein